MKIHKTITLEPQTVDFLNQRFGKDNFSVSIDHVVREFRILESRMMIILHKNILADKRGE